MKQKSRKVHKQQRFKVLPGEGRRFSFSRIRQAFAFYIFILIALVIIVQLGYHWLGDQFLAWRLQVVTAEPGMMQQEVRTDGVVTRHEVTIKAPADGLILQLSGTEERVPAGTELAILGALSQADFQSIRGFDGQDPDEDLWKQLITTWQEFFTADSEGEEEQNEETEYNDRDQIIDNFGDFAVKEFVTIYNERPGHLSYYIDGWEEFDGPFYPSGTDIENYQEGSLLAEGDLVEAGQPILKIVDNWQWYYSIVLPLHPGRTLTGLPAVEIEFDFAPNAPVQAKIYHFEIDELSKDVRLTFIIEKQLPGFDRVRRTEASLFYRRQQGIIVPAEALFEKDQRVGVYLNQGGRVIFHPVTVIERQEEKVMVEGLDPFSLVISRPELVEEGQRLN